MSNPSDPDTQASIVQAHRDLVRGKAQRASVDRDPSTLFPSMLRNLATMIKNCENMYDDRDDTRMPTEDSDAIVEAIESISGKVGESAPFRARGVDACPVIADRVTEFATVLAGRLRVLDLMLEQDGYIVCSSCNGHGTVYIEAAGDDATCNDCRGRGYTEPDEPAPNRWRNVEGDTWWRPDADCHVFSTAADDAWWWALGSGDTLRCGSEGTREDAIRTADDYIAGMWAERIQDPPSDALATQSPEAAAAVAALRGEVTDG